MSDALPSSAVEEPRDPSAPADAASAATPSRGRVVPFCMGIVSPMRENPVWTLLGYLPCRKFLGLWPTVALVGAGFLAGFAGYQKHHRTDSIVFAVVFFTWVLLSPLMNLAPQMGFHRHVRRNGLGEALFSAPIPPDAFVGAFLRYYLAVLLQCVLALAAFWTGALLAAPAAATDTLADTGVQWFVAGVIALWSATYWVAISRGPLFVFVGLYILMVVHEVADPFRTDVKLFNDDSSLFWHTSVIVWVVLAIAGVVYCRVAYAERLRARLFP